MKTSIGQFALSFGMAFGVSLGLTQCRAQENSSEIDAHEIRREIMVRHQIEKRGIRDQAVLDAMGKVAREEFVPAHLREHAYSDSPLPIGHDQTISQPYIVAYMTAALELKPESRVLEIGTGSGYQAAVLAEIVREVYSIEIVEPLGKRAAKTLQDLGYDKVKTRIGDGYAGWPEEAPFDAIIVTAAPEKIPQALIDQLAPGGRMVVPVGPNGGVQQLVRLRKGEDGTVQREKVMSVRFVPMTGGDEPED